jgi:glycerol-3-phosphate dehydrogenase (NAD(P)+)
MTDAAAAARPTAPPSGNGAAVAVLGAGAWGTALAVALAAGGPVRLWAQRDDQAAELARTRSNPRYLPGVLLPAGVDVTAHLPEAIASAGIILLAAPAAAVAGLCERLVEGLAPAAVLTLAAKGFEQSSGRLLHEVVEQHLPDQPLCAISGPTFAGELARGCPSALVVAARDREVAETVAKRMRQPWLRAYSSTDLIGVEVAGAVKNVLAIAAGVGDGLGLGANARAALITRGLAEITRLGAALGGQAATFMGLAGLGDVVLTCTDDQSRNRRFGLALARGLSPEDAVREVGQVVEGARTAPLALALAERAGVDLPICREVAALVAGQSTPAEALHHLLAREPRSEFS